MSLNRARPLAFLILITLTAPWCNYGCARPASEQPVTRGPKSAGQAEPEKFLFQVSINKYRDGIPPLSGAVNDALELRRVMQEKFGFINDEQHMPAPLVDDAATHDAIRDGFKKYLIENAKRVKEKGGAEAIVVFHFSGHGSQIKDEDNEEEDGWDETLVPIDGRNYTTYESNEILDDELSQWFETLSQYTKNITFILDSCHSDSGTRAPGTTRDIPRDPRFKSKHARPASEPNKSFGHHPALQKLKDEETVDILPPSQNFVTIAACLADQKAHEIDYTTDSGEKKPMGALTFYLTRALREAQPDTSYRELIEKVDAQVSTNSGTEGQLPQVEGDARRFIFNGQFKGEAPSIEIVKESIKGRMIEIKAGAAHALQPGALVAIYQAGAKMYGEEKKLTTGIVKEVKAVTAIVELGEEKLIPPDARAVIVSPNYGLERMRISLGAGLRRTAADANGADDPVLRLVAARIKDPSMTLSNLAQVVDADSAPVAGRVTSAPYDVAIKRGLFSEAFSSAFEEIKRNNGSPDEIRRYLSLVDPFDSTKVHPVPKASQEGYYLADPRGNPLLGYFEPSNQADGQAVNPEIIANAVSVALKFYARQRNLILLRNATSSFKDSVKLTVWHEPDAKNRVAEAEPMKEFDQSSYVFKQGEAFKFQLANKTTRDLYVTLLGIGTSGKIALFLPRDGPSVKLQPGIPVEVRPRRPDWKGWCASGPAGVDVYKLIITSSKADFSFLQQPGVSIATRRSDQSPIEWLISQADGLTRDAGAQKVDDWVTLQINVSTSGQAVESRCPAARAAHAPL
jgi:hypothetical protein